MLAKVKCRAGLNLPGSKWRSVEILTLAGRLRCVVRKTDLRDDGEAVAAQVLSYGMHRVVVSLAAKKGRVTAGLLREDLVGMNVA